MENSSRDGNTRPPYLPPEKSVCNLKQWTGSKLGEEYIKAIYCHPAYLISVQSQKVKVKVIQLWPTLQPHGLCSLWNSLGQNTSVTSLSFLQEIFPTHGSNPGLPPGRQILYQLNTREAQEYWSG